MSTTARVSVFLLALVAIAVVAAPAVADPLPGQWPKFVQKPMIETKINDVVYYGHDESSTARALAGAQGYYQGDFMADDFADRFDQEVVHVAWWGSYMDPTGVQSGVRRFLISFESDIPEVVDASGNVLEPSRPGDPILSQIVTLTTTGVPAPGTFTEEPVPYGTPVPPPEPVYKYNAELRCPFPQEANKVYWLKIVALLEEDQSLTWGWHNRDYTQWDQYASTFPAVDPGERKVGDIPNPDGTVPTPIYHFQDDAVTGQVTVHWIGPEPCNVEVFQDVAMPPTHYMDDVDGPGPMAGFPDYPGIGRFSKDLAFVLHAVPEPSTLVLLALGLACLAGWRWRR